MHCQEFPCPLIHLSEFLPCIFQESSRLSYKRDGAGIYSFDKRSAAKLGFKLFSSSSGVIFSYFLLSLFILGSLFPIFPSTCRFPSLQAFLFFPGFPVQFLPLFVFSHNHYQHSTFLNAKFHPYNLTIFLLFLFMPSVFFLSGKYFYIIHANKVINIFLWFCELVNLT